MTCATCANTHVSIKNLPSRDGFDLEIAICHHCGHYFQTPEQYRDVYSTGEFSEEARHSSEPTDTKIKELDKRALDRIEFYADILEPHQHVLEVGSSIGSFIHLLKLMGKEVKGLEPDPVYAAFSHQQYFLNQDSGLLEDYQSNEQFNLICSFHVIEHVQHLNTFIQKAWDLLTDNGELLFECPSLDIHMYGNMRTTIWKPHMHYFTLASMYALLSQKFDVLELGYYGMSLYVHARKAKSSTFSERKFQGYLRSSKRTSALIRVIPGVSVAGVDKFKLKQLFLQPLMQKRGNKLSRYKTLGTFAIKGLLYEKRESGFGGPKATHVSYYSAWENAGDTVLSKAVRTVLNSKLTNTWSLKNITAPVTEKVIDQINRGQYLVIGGGGVLLPDSNSNRISGWQWAISKEQLNRITVPIIVFAIGYNYFKGQTPDELFVQNLNALIKRADFFSLRNFGSIEKVKSLVEPSLHDKIIYQPCPTTVISRFFPLIKKQKGTKKIGFNVAYDRYPKRFGEDMYLILDQLALTAKEISQKGYKIYCINHLKGDEKFELSLRKHNVQYTAVNLQHTLPVETINFYNDMELVFGARGHAQMIPFGTNTRIISLGTHDKLKFFLKDINALDWYEDLTYEPEQLKERLLERFYRVNELKNGNDTDELLHQTQTELFKITQENLDRINKLINKG